MRYTIYYYISQLFPVTMTSYDPFQMIAKDPDNFKQLVQSSLVRHVNAINQLADKGKTYIFFMGQFQASVGVSPKVHTDDTLPLRTIYVSQH